MLVRALVNSKTREVKLGQLLNLCTVNALGRVMLGYRVFGDGSGASDARADEFKAMVVEVMVLAGIFNIGEFVPVQGRLGKRDVVSGTGGKAIEHGHGKRCARMCFLLISPGLPHEA